MKVKFIIGTFFLVSVVTLFSLATPRAQAVCFFGFGNTCASTETTSNTSAGATTNSSNSTTATTPQPAAFCMRTPTCATTYNNCVASEASNCNQQRDRYDADVQAYNNCINSPASGGFCDNARQQLDADITLMRAYANAAWSAQQQVEQQTAAQTPQTNNSSSATTNTSTNGSVFTPNTSGIRCIDPNSELDTSINVAQGQACPSGWLPRYNGLSTTQVNGNINYVPLEPLPFFTDSFLSDLANGRAKFGDLLNAVFKLLIVLGSLFAIAAFVYSGITYMVSDVVDMKSQAKKRLSSAMWGLLLLLGAWIILFTINPQLVIFGGGFNPQDYYYTVSPNQQPSGCIGAACLNQTEQTAVQNTQQNGTLGASAADVQTTQQVSQDQNASCVRAGGSVVTGVAPSTQIIVSGTDRTPCQIQGFSSCTQLAAGRSWCGIR